MENKHPGTTYPTVIPMYRYKCLDCGMIVELEKPDLSSTICGGCGGSKYGLADTHVVYMNKTEVA